MSLLRITREDMVSYGTHADESRSMDTLSAATGRPSCEGPVAPADHSPQSQATARSLVPILVLITVVAVVVEGFMVSASRLWAVGDAGMYLKLAAGIADRLDFGHEYFQIRGPGYPLLLAIIFRVFGTASPQVILVVQHAMVAGSAVLGALLAWTLWPRRSFALLAGLFGAFSLHLSAYANMVMTEVPYAFVLTACVLLLVRYHVAGGWGWLVGASAAAGLCATIKSIGELMPLLCLGVALHRMWTVRRRSVPVKRRCWLRATVLSLLAATGPAAAFILPVMLNNYRTCGYFQLSCCGDMALYHRAVAREKLDSDSSAALAQVRETLEEAKHRGLIPSDVRLGDKFRVNAAYRAVHGVSMAEAAKVMGQAAWDLIAENPGLILRRGVRYAYRSLFMPDLHYRVVPGEIPAEMFDMEEATRWTALYVGPRTMAKYLPLNDRPTLTSPLRGGITRWYREHVEKGSPILGLVDTPYEEFVLLCVLGGLLSLVQANRMVWMVPGLVVFCHVVCSAYLIETAPRWVVPVHPLLHVFGAFGLVRVGQVVVVNMRALGSRCLPVRRATS